MGREGAPEPDEVHLLENYRICDDAGKETLTSIAELQAKRCKQQNELKPFLFYLALLVILIILILREIRCWYWKINKRIENQREMGRQMQAMIDFQKEQIHLLETIINKMNSGNSHHTPALDEAAATTENIKEQ